MAQSLEYDSCGLHRGSNLDSHCSMFILQVLLSQKQQSVDEDKNCCIFSVVGVVQIERKRVFRLQISFKTSRVIKIDTNQK